MRTPFASRAQFDEKTATLANAVETDADDAAQLLAHLAGYTDAASVDYAAAEKSDWSSREELVARLLASRPGMDSGQAASVIELLALPVRDADIEHVGKSPDVVPNMGG